MKILSLSATFTVFVGLGIAAFAQDPAQRAPLPQQTEPGGSARRPVAQLMTVTGCLMKGANPSEFSITDSKSGEKFSFAAPDQLQKYVNQTVELTGTVMVRNGDRAFRPESVSTISDSCGPSQ